MKADEEKRFLSDEELARTALRDPSAFSNLMNRHRKRLFSFISANLIKDWDQADDVVQETFIKAYLNLDKFDLAKKWTTWLYRIAINTAYSHLKKPKIHSLESYYVYTLSTGDVPERAVENKMQKEKIAQAIFSLESRHKLILNLYVEQELTYEEMSKLLDLSRGAVKNRVESALKNLRIILGPLE